MEGGSRVREGEGVERVAGGGVEEKIRAVGMRSTQRRGREEFGNISLEG